MREVHADGALSGRAPKGWFSGTRVRFYFGSCPKKVGFRHGVRFSMESCPKGVVFRHGTDSILHCRPQVSSQKKDTCRRVEGFSSILPHLNSKVNKPLNVVPFSRRMVGKFSITIYNKIYNRILNYFVIQK